MLYFGGKYKVLNQNSVVIFIIIIIVTTSYLAELFSAALCLKERQATKKEDTLQC